MMTNSLTDIPGIRVGHAHDLEALTGCTVVLCPPGTIGGVDKRGGAPSSRQTDQLETVRLVNEVHAVLLGGGSAFGLDAASGVVGYLEEHEVGFDMRVARVPIVPAAILFDLLIGRGDVRPDAAMGYQACENASERRPAEGNVGAGTGATVGKILGKDGAMKAGLGTASREIGGGLVVGALVAVNAFGDVIQPRTGEILAGARLVETDEAGNPITTGFANTLSVMEQFAASAGLHMGRRENTVIGVVATNARLDKEGINKVAQMAHDGLARTIRPAHTMFDGDTIFGLATGEIDADPSLIGAFAAEVFAEAVLRGVTQATSAGGFPAVGDLAGDK
jgi:L-aminopeptidase/D-esterase-like protein